MFSATFLITAKKKKPCMYITIYSSMKYKAVKHMDKIHVLIHLYNILKHSNQ